jgi:hypothetical protein
MPSSGMLRRVALVRTDVSEEFSASFIRVTKIGELGTTLAVTSNRLFLRSVRRLLVTASVFLNSPILVTLIKEALSSSETSVLRRATRRNIPEDAILHSDNSIRLSRRSPEKEQWIWENDVCGDVYEIGLVKRPQKLNDVFGKTIHLGTIDRGFTV